MEGNTESKNKNLRVECTGDYFGDEESRFFILKGQVKNLPEDINESLEKALSQGLLRETDKQLCNEAKLSDRVGGPGDTYFG